MRICAAEVPYTHAGHTLGRLCTGNAYLHNLLLASTTCLFQRKQDAACAAVNLSHVPRITITPIMTEGELHSQL
jgi:hypothetical protein